MKGKLWIVVLIIGICASLIIGYKIAERFIDKKDIEPIESSQPVEKFEPTRELVSKIDKEVQEEGEKKEIAKEKTEEEPKKVEKKTTQKKVEEKPKTTQKKVEEKPKIEPSVVEEPSVIEESSIVEEPSVVEESSIVEESSAEVEVSSKIAEEKPKTLEEKKKYWESINPPPSGKHLTKRGGVFQGASGKETYYNLNMKGVLKNIVYGHEWKGSLGLSEEEYPYWVRSDGAKMIGQYIMCAANLDIRPYGTILDTSLGKAIVVDTGTFAKKNPTQVDIAVNW